jgi:diguanylate cyclase (GGDEF)-like protein
MDATAISSRILNARILIVDDSEVNVKLLEYMLAGAGYVSVASTTDARRVFDLYDEHRYDIILLDLNMPHMDGFQVMESLKTIETEGYLPVLVVTAEPGHKLRALQAGAKDFVSKPIDQTEVLTRVHNMLEIRLMHKDLRNRNESLALQVSEQSAELRAAAEKLSYLSNFDSITGLPNRILLRDRVRRTKERLARTEEVMGFLVVELARLPLIRGSLGIKAEQGVLKEVAARLGQWIHPEDTVARFGDDSLAVVVVRSGPEGLAAAAHRIVELLDQPFHFDDQELHVEACIGIAIFPDDGTDFDFLAQAAEASMHTAMAGKAQRCLFYTPELNRQASERLKLENALRRALERDELLLHYQPQLDLASGAVIGLEALIRWQHPELGLVPPARFIGLAEDTGLILPIGEWVLLQACRQNKAWQDAGLPAIPVAVNLSSKQFSGNIASLVRTVLADTGLDPGYLELELTESLSMEDPERTVGILRELKDMGVRLSIDDFGTGYSNLNYLKRFPVDKLKLDQSFVRELISDPDDLSIARAVIAMARSLRLKVIAEGVETEGQLALLARNGCDEMQGYLFSRPIDVTACAALLRQGKSLALDRTARRPYARTLLFVDDGKNIGAAIERTLVNKGYLLLIAGSVAEAFEMLATNDVGVILCEQQMPELNGVEFLSRVKQMYPSIVGLVSSGSTAMQPGTDAASHGAVFKFLPRPCEEAALLKALDDAFRQFES